ncbi:MAG: indolepyruvate oxidoreductase subunit B [Rhizobiales bacterium 65-9]|nr:indolepyruvate oxidoreductase subunit beta family protein [Hyphomicrobiales bacterium]OJY37958.1 MAG: indolepyruvate oxidoreductase subunit B [Rhizobiales bacterium 65-9]
MAEQPARSIRLAILAMGGEGGGVLADWIIDLAEHAGFIAQTTSVPGVAQRTGATIYYLELFERAASDAARRPPVLAMTPIPGDVDIVVASELMEAGRAVQRGIVTPDRTTLVTSTHRVFAMTEKIALGDGRSDAPALFDACRTAAHRFVAFDMAAIAQKSGSVISAAMFGALAGSGALPFSREQFEQTIERGGVGVSASKRAFGMGYDVASGKAEPEPVSAPGAVVAPTLAPPSPTDLDALFPAPALATIRTGVERLTDYQDAAYARLYIERLKPIAQIDRSQSGAELLTETARHLALGMAYEDTIRVAELKTRPSRFDRVRDEAQVKDGQILQISEYLHPRLQEIAETVPAPLGRMMLNVKPLRWLIEKTTAKGRVVTTTSIRGFLLLYAVARLKPWRRKSMRFAEEQKHLEAWLAALRDLAPRDYALALELAECRNLVKGYGDTHVRGRANYERLVGLIDRLLGLQQPAKALAELRSAALADDTGARLDAAVAKLGLN